MSGETPLVDLDLTGLASNLDPGVLDQLDRRAGAAYEAARSRIDGGEVGFAALADDTALADRVQEYARGLPPEIDTMVVVGIGGSSLGPHAVYSALAAPFDTVRARAGGEPLRLFFPDNSDPHTFTALLDRVDLSKTIFNVVTKSGGTAETAAQTLVLADRVRQSLGDEAIASHVVVTTDPERGDLRALSERWNVPAFPIPPNVGGRFSVLSAVGLLPAAVAGVDVHGLLRGARTMRDAVLGEHRSIRDNPALALAALLHHHNEHGRPMVVMMPYADALFDAADWFRQLWAESLGKDGRGPTPIASRGATDQHSQLQLYAGGPDDKVYVVVAPNVRQSRLPLPDVGITDLGAYGYLSGREMGELLDAELIGTVSSLRSRGRPTAVLRLADVSAPALGAFFLLWEAATAFAGQLYDVDPYDQPGVEEAKRLAFGALGRAGFDPPDEQHLASNEERRFWI